VSRANDPVHPNMMEAGLTIREHFAAMAMQGIASRAHLESNSMVAIAALSVQMADALIAELAK
jgi:hypothetical protein